MDKVNEAYWRGYRNGYACAMEDNAKLTLVRCKDCWIFHQDETWNPKAGLCGWFDRPVGVNDFCSNGERKEDETD